MNLSTILLILAGLTIPIGIAVQQTNEAEQRETRE